MSQEYKIKEENVRAIRVPGTNAVQHEVQAFMLWIFTFGSNDKDRYWTVSSHGVVELINGESGEKTHVSEGDYLVQCMHGLKFIWAMTERQFYNKYEKVIVEEEEDEADG